MPKRARIMYVEYKGEGLVGPARIGRITYSKTGSTLHYKDKAFQSLKGSGFKSNYFDLETHEQYWISGPRKDGMDSLYATNVGAEIDEDVREEYWTLIRKKPALKSQKHT